MKKNEKTNEFSCRIHERYWDALDGLSIRVQNDVLGALVRAFFTGESQEDKLKGIARNLYVSLEEPVFFSRKRALAGRKGGEANAQTNSEANREAKAKQNDKQSGKQTHKQSGKQKPSLIEIRDKREESECVLRVDTLLEEKQHTPTLDEISTFFQARGCSEQAASRFYRHYAAQGWKRGNGNQITDWRLVAEQWIEEDGSSKSEPLDVPDSAQCPRCGHDCSPIDEGSPVFACGDCNITFRTRGGAA